MEEACPECLSYQDVTITAGGVSAGCPIDAGWYVDPLTAHLSDAGVDAGGGGGDAGDAGGRDGGVDAGAEPDSGVDPDGGGDGTRLASGCGCHTAESSSRATTSWALIALFLSLAALVLRRKDPTE